MPYIGRYTRYPIYPQFGADSTKFQNILAVTFEQDLFTPGQILNYQFKTASAEVRLYDLVVEFIESEVDFTILEDATCVDGVTVVPAGTADRNSSFVTSVFASSDPTGIVGGNTLDSLEHFGLPSPIIGFADPPPASVNYVTLKFNSNYIFRLENVGTENIIDMRLIILWAE